MALSRLPEIVCTGKGKTKCAGKRRLELCYRPIADLPISSAGYGVERPECSKLLEKPTKATSKETKSKSVLSRLFTAYTGF